LLDAQLLCQVYVELTGGRQIGLGLVANLGASAAGSEAPAPAARALLPARPHSASVEELSRHRAFMSKVIGPLWDRFARAS